MCLGGVSTTSDPLKLDARTAQCIIEVGERYSFKIKYRFQVYVPKRQILR